MFYKIIEIKYAISFKSQTSGDRTEPIMIFYRYFGEKFSSNTHRSDYITGIAFGKQLFPERYFSKINLKLIFNVDALGFVWINVARVDYYVDDYPEFFKLF